MTFSIKNTMLSILLVLSMLFTAACTPIKMENTNNNELTVKVLNIGQGFSVWVWNDTGYKVDITYSNKD